MKKNTWANPDLSAFLGLDTLGLVAVAQRVSREKALVLCRVTSAEANSFCKRCGAQSRQHDTVERQLHHLPVGWRPTILVVRVRRFRCLACRHVWPEDTTAMAEPKAKLSRTAINWALFALVIHHMSIKSVATTLGVSWHTASDAIMAEAQRTLLSDPHRFDGVAVIGVDEHRWSHPNHTGERKEHFVTVIIDLTPVVERRGPARLLDVVEGRSKQVFASWMEARPKAVAGQNRARRNGWLHRLQIRCHARATRCGGSDGSVPRHPPHW